MVKIGINGFGRLGRLLLRISFEQCGKGAPGSMTPLVTIVNDPDLPPEHIGYLLKKDTLYGTFQKEIIDINNALVIDGQTIQITHERDTTRIPWRKNCSVDYVVDTTGKNTTCATATKHLQAGIKNVLVTGLADIPVFCVGINHTCYKTNMKTLSIGSPSLNCVTAILKVLHENFGVEKAMATAIHPLSNNDQILDCSEGGREGRSATLNFMPARSSAPGRYISKVMPELDGKVESSAIRIPVPCIGAVDLTATLKKDVSYDVIKLRFKEAAACYMKGIIDNSTDQLVSSDVVGNPHSCVFDAFAGVGLPKSTVKIFAWYDAEYAFAYRLYDMIKYVASREVCSG